MYFVTPTYFRPMLENFVGLLLLGVLLITICADFGLGWAVIRLFRKGRYPLGVMVLVGYLLTWLAAVWIVVLGPAALILMKPRS
jgi:hypothetical protein